MFTAVKELAYLTSHEREREKRRNLRLQFGGRCALCGYNRYLNVLHFHHLDRTEKYLWSRNGGASIREIEAHPERFMLLCPNCHAEIHLKEVTCGVHHPFGRSYRGNEA